MLKKLIDSIHFFLAFLLVAAIGLLGRLWGQYIPLLHIVVILYPVMRNGTDFTKLLIYLASFLIKIGRDVNSPDCQGRRPLHYAIRQQEYLQMARFLIKNGAFLESKDDNNSTPLLWASNYGCYEGVELLVTEGADVNAKDSCGCSALHKVAHHWEDSSCLSDITELLIVSGVAVDSLDEYGRTSIQYAISNHLTNVEKPLRANITNGDFFNSRGVEELDQGNFRSAEIDFTKSIKYNPSCAGFFTNRSVARWSMKNYRGSLEDANVAVRLDPSFYGTWERRGAVKIELRLMEEAITDLNQAIELNPDFGSSYYNRGLAFLAIGERRNAISDFEKALSLYKENGEEGFYQETLQILKRLAA